MIEIVVGLVKTLVLLVPAVVCLASPKTVQWTVVDLGRRRGLGRQWQETVLTAECAVAIRLCGGVLLVMSLLLGAAMLKGV